MLEAIRERSKGWLAKTILALITIPFALWGIESYLQQAGSNVAVAKVGDDTITVQQYSNALQGVRNQLQADGKADPSVLDSPLLKQSVLDRLINNRLLNQEVKRSNFYIGDEQLSKFIIEMPEFQGRAADGCARPDPAPVGRFGLGWPLPLRRTRPMCCIWRFRLPRPRLRFGESVGSSTSSTLPR